MDRGRAPTEREVLRVLWRSPSEHLVRSEIRRRMPRAHRPTLGRIGQILAALHRDGLLDRVIRQSQGSRKAGFFALSDRGRELSRQLGFEREERLLFPVSEEMLRKWLTQERLRPKAPGRIVAVYGFRGRLGRTTLVAHVARGLARNLEDGENLLVVDLDLETAGLDDFFPALEARECRGLGGLLLDFERLEPCKRALWLRGALSKPEYVLHPLEDEVPGLAYLPSGLSPGQGALSPSERAEAMALLRTEAGLAVPATGRSDPHPKLLGFLAELRKAVLERFERAVVDPQSGHSLGAWIATQTLADELVLCAQEDDKSPATLAGVRAVLANFLRQRAENGAMGEVLFLFRLAQPTNLEDLNPWIELHLTMEDTEPDQSLNYRAEQLVNDARLAKNRHRWEYAHFYEHLIARLDPRSNEPGTSPPELQALLAVLDPEKTLSVRSIAAGVLENTPLQDLARWIDGFVLKGSLPAETDTDGEGLIRGILTAKFDRLLWKILEKPKLRRIT